MPIVDIEKLEKDALTKKEEQTAIISKLVGDKTFFKGKFLDGWYDSFDECLKENQQFKRIEDNKAQGLNDQGQTPEQVEKQAKKRLMVKELNEVLEKASKLQAEIQNFNSQDGDEKTSKKVKK